MYECAASIPVVGFNAIMTSEHFGAFLTFVVLHAALLIRYIKVRTLSYALCPMSYTLYPIIGARLYTFDGPGTLHPEHSPDRRLGFMVRICRVWALGIGCT